MEKPFTCRRRKIGSTRFDVNVDVQFSSQEPPAAAIEAIGVARNLSLRGALIETHALVTTDHKLTLYLTLPNRDDLLKIPTVAVRWVRGHQIGVEFLKLDAGTSLELMKYLSGIHTAARLTGDTQ